VSSILLLCLAVLIMALLGYGNWVVGVAQREALQQRTALDVVETGSARWINRLDVRLRRSGAGRWMHRRLERAGLEWRVVDVWLGLIGLGLVCYLITSPFISWWFALLVVAGVIRLALSYFDWREGKRRDRFVAQLPEVARVLSNATSAGLALRSAIRMASDEMTEPAGHELRRLSDELDVGTPLNDALTNLQDRLPSRELSLLTRTLIIQARAGGAVVTALRGMSETLEARKDLRREIQTMLSGAVYTSWLVLVLGVGSLMMLNLIAPGTLNKVTSTLPGQVTLIVAALLYALGFLMIRKTTRIEV
jgi:tight adherence protein B